MVGGGSGSLPRNIIEAVEAQGRQLAGYLDAEDDAGQLMHPRDCLGSERLLADPSFLAAHDIAVAVSGPQRHAKCSMLLLERNANLPVIVHPAATLSVTAMLGP